MLPEHRRQRPEGPQLMSNHPARTDFLQQAYLERVRGWKYSCGSVHEAETFLSSVSCGLGFKFSLRAACSSGECDLESRTAPIRFYWKGLLVRAGLGQLKPQWIFRQLRDGEAITWTTLVKVRVYRHVFCHAHFFLRILIDCPSFGINSLLHPQ